MWLARSFHSAKNQTKAKPSSKNLNVFPSSSSLTTLGGTIEQDVCRPGQTMQEQHRHTLNLRSLLPRKWTDGLAALHQVRPEEEWRNHEGRVHPGIRDNGEG